MQLCCHRALIEACCPKELLDAGNGRMRCRLQEFLRNLTQVNAANAH